MNSGNNDDYMDVYNKFLENINDLILEKEKNSNPSDLQDEKKETIKKEFENAYNTSFDQLCNVVNKYKENPYLIGIIIKFFDVSKAQFCIISENNNVFQCCGENYNIFEHLMSIFTRRNINLRHNDFPIIFPYVICGFTDVVEKLIKLGANVNDNVGALTPLICTIAYGDAELINLLFYNQANLTSEDIKITHSLIRDIQRINPYYKTKDETKILIHDLFNMEI